MSESTEDKKKEDSEDLAGCPSPVIGTSPCGPEHMAEKPKDDKDTDTSRA